MKRLSLTAQVALGAVVAACAWITLATFERPPVTAVQVGYRGTGMEQVNNPRLARVTRALNQAPEATDLADTEGDKASAIYENVQLLGDLSQAQFLRIMAAMTEWVSPDQGCNYCHNPENLASDEVYTKVVTRRMLQMVRTINQHPHVGQTGVTCYTCHRGQPVPAEVWSTVVERRAGLQAPTGQNTPAPAAGWSSLPRDPFTPFLLQDNVARNISTTWHPGTNRENDTPRTEWTYSLMMHMSTSLGVNCTYCHNSRAFARWEESPPPRLTAWHGIRMVQIINRDYIEPLTPLWVANPNGPPDAPRVARLGPHGDALKTNCTTCHRGVNKPLYGAQMLSQYPELGMISAGPARAAELAPR